MRTLSYAVRKFTLPLIKYVCFRTPTMIHGRRDLWTGASGHHHTGAVWHSGTARIGIITETKQFFFGDFTINFFPFRLAFRFSPWDTLWCSLIRKIWCNKSSAVLTLCEWFLSCSREQCFSCTTTMTSLLGQGLMILCRPMMEKRCAYLLGAAWFWYPADQTTRPLQWHPASCWPAPVCRLPRAQRGWSCTSLTM